jgi:hypothetical protein
MPLLAIAFIASNSESPGFEALTITGYHWLSLAITGYHWLSLAIAEGGAQ